MALQKDSSLLITGALGFVGSHLLEYLLDRGYTNIAVTDRQDREVPDGVTLHVLDLTDSTATKECFEKCSPEYIINLASVATVGDSFEKAEMMLHSNTTLMLSVLEAMKQVSPKARLLQISSAAVYGQVSKDLAAHQNELIPLNPINPYAVSKLTQELLTGAYQRSYGLDAVYVRPFNHIGEKQTTAFAVPSFAHQIIEIERGNATHIEVGNLDAIRDFSDVKDIVRAYELLLDRGETGEVYNVGSGEGHSIKEMLSLLIAESTAKITVVEREDRMRPLDIPVSIADNEKITALGWHPEYKIQDTVKRIVDWHRNQ
ncbi:MAG: GDP-mannose 4,6-dehydratase [Pseudomonadales bacterium]|nr:GDP-mannose 4,6-dehydratase [Candidatus Woesebacteria bacterium]MCB9800867.1 GDP-mannose 4,6-dehydratase [Pseudomonadales bacterium]